MYKACHVRKLVYKVNSVWDELTQEEANCLIRSGYTLIDLDKWVALREGKVVAYNVTRKSLYPGCTFRKGRDQWPTLSHS